MPHRTPRRSRRARRNRLLVGAVLASLALAGARLVPDPYAAEGDLFVLSLVSVLLAAGSLIAEGLGVAVAIVELLLGVMAGIIGVEPAVSLDLLGLVGSVFIMYIAGLEIEPDLIKEYLSRSILGGLVSFLAPALASFAVLRLVLGVEWLPAWLAATGVSTTSVAVVYAILRGRGALRRATGQVVLAVAMVADIASIVAFALLMAGLSLPVILYFLGLVAAVLGLSRFLEWASGGENEVELRLILAFLVGAALVSEWVGVHAILFAFLLGVATRHVVLRDRSLLQKVSGLTFGVLAPLFFVDAGLHASPSNALLYAELSLLLLAVSMPAKVFSTHLALRLLVPRRVPLRLAVVFGARLTVSTIIAFTGESLGVLPHDLAGSIILSALIATVLAGLAAGSPLSGDIEV